jgi:hypothetical protein
VTTTLPAALADCEVCGGGGQTAPGTACPVCHGIGMASPAVVAGHRARMVEAALAGAVERARRLGAAGVDLERRAAQQARQDAAEHHRLAEQAAQRAESALAQMRTLSEQEQAARAEHATATQRALDAFIPLALPPNQPGGLNLPITGGTREPTIYGDSISCRQLDVWGSLNIPGGSGGLMTNPMNTLGDIITGAAGGTPARLGIGGTGQVLTVVGGVPQWANSAAGFANPMTQAGQLITSGVGGTAIAIGPAPVGSLLYSNGTPAFGQGPLTSLGDLLIGAAGGTGSTPGRLAAGALNNVLTSQGPGTAPAWLPAPGGSPNPLTTKGDMIYALAGGTQTRLPIGAISQILTVSAGGIPSWGTTTTTVIQPSGDATGATDTAAINAANTAFDTANTGGRIQLGPGTFYITSVTLSAQCVSGTSGGSGVSMWGTGSSTLIFQVGNGIGISLHRTSGYAAQFGQPAQQTTSQLKYFTLDGTNATAGAIGLDYGDGWGYDIDVTIANYTAANSIGCQQINRVFWTEKAHVKLNLLNSIQPFIITRTSAGDHSAEYNHYELYIFINTDAAGATMYNGVQVLGGMNLGGVDIEAHGNVSSLPAGWNLTTNPVALFSFVGNDGSGDWSRTYAARLKWKIEQNPGVPNTGNYPYQIYMGSNNNAIKQTSGAISYTGGNSPNGQANGGEFSFDGPILGDTYLSNLSTGAPGSATTITSQPSFPGYGVIQQNYGPNAQVSVTGGGVTGVVISGQATGMATGTFFVQAGASITVNGAGANPTVYSWAPACASTF